MEQGRFPLLLPHEVMAALISRGSNQEFLSSTTNMAFTTKLHLEACRQTFQEEHLVGLGMWADGVPYGGHGRVESLEILTMSLPGLPGDLRNFRFPMAVFAKRYQVARATWDAIFEIVVWSLQCLLSGVWPLKRHDGSEFAAGDAGRLRSATKPLGCKAVLVEVRGDRAAYKQLFRLPQHNEVAGCCFRCAARPQDIRQVGQEATWRQEPLSRWDLLNRMQQQPAGISPLLAAPGLKVGCFKLDWLHLADQGVAADWAGGVLDLLLETEAGNAREKCEALYRALRLWYEREGVQDRLPTLQLHHFRKAGKTPKLKSKAAQCRALVPWLAEVSRDRLGDSVEHQTIKAACQHLLAYYEEVHSNTCRPETLASEARKFALLVVALADRLPLRFGVKPKLHLWLHLCEEEGSTPADTWCYRDEGVGGLLAALARRRGGPNTPAAIGAALLRRFQAKEPVPCML